MSAFQGITVLRRFSAPYFRTSASRVTLVVAAGLCLAAPGMAQSVGGSGGSDADGNPVSLGAGGVSGLSGVNGITSPARTDPGTGGGGGGPGGGTGGTGGGPGGGAGGAAGAAGADGTGRSAGGGGGGGLNGLSTAVLSPGGALLGGNGGAGGSQATRAAGSLNESGGGGGGAGGYGVVVTGSGASASSAAITGGTGGAGGAGNQGGNGGDGGGGAYFSAGASFTNLSAITIQGGTGGAGGNGGLAPDPNIGFSGTTGINGNGGAGGAGVYFAMPGGSLFNQGTAVIRGGDGGVSGQYSAGGNLSAGTGGIGGIGVSLTQGSITNQGIIFGGTGGGGAAAGPSGGDGGAGGQGAAGISAANATIVNLQNGTIGGGSGGVGGLGRTTIFFPGFDGAGGAGGYGITGSNLSVTTAGSISGGLSSDGTTRADAIHFSGGSNTLELQSGYGFTGRVVGTGGDALRLGGTTNGTFDVAQIGASAQFRGFSAFEKTGAATWTLTSTTAQATPWTLTQGTLSVSSDANLGAAGGALTFNGGVLRVTGTAFASTSRTINWGAGGGGFDIASAANTFTVGQSLGGNGGLVKLGDGTLTLTGANTYTGQTTVSAGRLTVNGSLASPVVVGANGALGGSGTLGGLSIGTGGIVAPGNSIGTLNIAGNVTFAAGSVYLVEANAAGASDRVNAAGIATLNGGSVQVVAANGTYAPSTRYTILTAAGGVAGQFASASSNLAFLVPSLSYGASSVFLTLQRNDISFAGVAQSFNQTSVAGALDRLPAGHAAVNAVFGLSAPLARNAFDQLSGEIYPSLTTARVTAAQTVQETLASCLGGGFAANAGVGSGRQGCAPAAPQDSGAVGVPSRLFTWAAGFGTAGAVRQDSNAATLSSETAGFLAGAEIRPTSTLRLGITGGYSSLHANARGRGSSGRGDSGFGGIYGGADLGSGLSLKAAILAGGDNLTANRTVAFPGFLDTTSGRVSGVTAQGFAELGYRVAIDRGSLEPFLRGALIHVGQGSVNETGNSAALSLRSGDYRIGQALFGLRGDYAPFADQALTLKGLVGWRTNIGTLRPEAQLSLAGGTPFTVQGAPLARSEALVETGLSYALAANIAVSANYRGAYSARTSNHGGRAAIDIKF